jgi:hypothetical protein
MAALRIALCLTAAAAFGIVGRSVVLFLGAFPTLQVEAAVTVSAYTAVVLALVVLAFLPLRGRS